MLKPRRDTFTGSNNIAKPERLPEGAVVEAVNLDFTVGGKAELRTGFELVGEFTDVRALFDMGDDLALVADDKLVRITPRGNTELANLSGGPVAACWHNDELFINTLNESLRVGRDVKPWAIEAPVFDIEVVAGNFPAGIYQVAVTAVQGVESGALPMIVRLDEGQGIRVNVTDDRDCRLYCSVVNGSTLYLQGIAYDTNLLGLPYDDSERLTTNALYRLPFCEQLASHGAMIVGAWGRYLFYTRPMMPHLHNPESDFLQFPAPVSVVISVDSGLFVCADKTYFITGLGSAELNQATRLEFGAVRGSAVLLPDGSATWFSEYGQVVGRKDGSIELINRDSYAPETAQQGSAGFLEHNGNQMVVTTMRGEPKGSGLRSTDHWDLEIIE